MQTQDSVCKRGPNQCVTGWRLAWQLVLFPKTATALLVQAGCGTEDCACQAKEKSSTHTKTARVLEDSTHNQTRCQNTWSGKTGAARACTWVQASAQVRVRHAASAAKNECAHKGSTHKSLARARARTHKQEHHRHEETPN